ncbi:single-stranded-DNA-specific exonuclease RecJ [Chitinivibrio alkaliphilus]|uniref:Single-stranded-DNA-specific exonuclease RecJ n=1 Tax=Chitinivibrio alkaliphilus ACht1 TaxID=1313304 RepID=U7D2L4_9BACT|nr:single-stranded-DNA-specific exonuclease RecJ [Chitinivibrio alkaliphilus]ERP30749.1 ssDNA-specific exonuclease RecJ [Chitinivibrio alkaliphilus ACht1]
MNSESIPRETIHLRTYAQSTVERLMKLLSISETLATILAGRGLTEFEQSKKFFNPHMDDFLDPFLFPHMDAVVQRLLQARHAEENVFIYGDYDVDGITGTSFFLRFLRKIGISCDYYIPNRLTEGYGISRAGIDTIAAQQADLILSVDTGITAVEEVAYAASLGIDMIITDHHEPKETEPDCLVIDPKSHQCPFPDANLSGVGVALKVAQALTQRGDFPPSYWQEELDLVALGTAADLVPFTGENRIITYYGYRQMSQTTCHGLRALMEVQKVREGDITTADIVFKLAPAINAAGRMGDPQRGVKLLLCEDPAKCQLYAKELLQKNHERRSHNTKVEREVEEWVQNSIDLSSQFGIVAAQREWHVGVVGIAASKIVEKYSRPSFIFAIDDSGIARGSARSVDGCNLIAALDECQDLLIQYGGHKMAAGATMKADNLAEFTQRFNTSLSRQLAHGDLRPRVYADVEVRVAQLTPKFFATLARMRPFGPNNMRPVFFSKAVQIHAPKRVGKGGAHLKMRVSQDKQFVDAIAFGFGDRLQELTTARSISLAYTLGQNTYRGTTTLQITVKGIEIEK